MRIRCISPALELLHNEVKILPAAGGAVQELQRPDEDELEDMLLNRHNNQITDFAETPEPTLAKLYRPTPPLFRSENHLYRYFIDGSLRTYYLATGIEVNRSFPIALAQIGAAVIERDDDGKTRALGIRNRILLLVPRGQYGISDSLWSELEKLNTPDGFFEVVDTSEKTEITPHQADRQDLRGRSAGIARHQMHLLEIAMIDLTDDLRDKNNWMILDGAIQFNALLSRKDKSNTIGVAKSFTKTPQFQFGRKRRNWRDITSILAGLPFAHRTVAFRAKFQSTPIAFWYVRLREQREMDYPLMGVVKVEIPLDGGEPIDADLADLLSRALVAERNVTPYGRDRRWHCHLYPIFQAEQAIKSQFYSQQVLMGVVRWPNPRLT